MKRIELTTDKAMIKQVLEPEYNAVTYDGCPSFADYDPDTKNSAWFILYQDKEIAGLIKMENLNYILWIPHIIIFEKYRGNNSCQWGKMAIRYMKSRIKDSKFLAMTPYVYARKYAEKCGLKHITTITDSLKKDGQLLDQYILEG